MKAIRKSPAERYRSWLDCGRDLSQAFVNLRLAGATYSDSEKFNRLRDMEFFQDFGDVALWEVVRVASWKTISGETIVIREGEQGDSFYLLLDNKINITLLNK